MVSLFQGFQGKLREMNNREDKTQKTRASMNKVEHKLRHLWHSETIFGVVETVTKWACVCVCVHVCASVCVCVCVIKGRKKEKEREWIKNGKLNLTFEFQWKWSCWILMQLSLPLSLPPSLPLSSLSLFLHSTVVKVALFSHVTKNNIFWLNISNICVRYSFKEPVFQLNGNSKSAPCLNFCNHREGLRGSVASLITSQTNVSGSIPLRSMARY